MLQSATHRNTECIHLTNISMTTDCLHHCKVIASLCHNTFYFLHVITDNFWAARLNKKTFGLRLGSIQRDYIDWIGMQTSGPNLLMFSSAEGWWQAERATSKRTASSATHYHRPQSASVWHQCQRNGLSSRHTGASALTATIHWYSHKTRWVHWQATFFLSESRSRTVRVNWNWFIWLVVYWDPFQPDCTSLQRVPQTETPHLYKIYKHRDT